MASAAGAPRSGAGVGIEPRGQIDRQHEFGSGGELGEQRAGAAFERARQAGAEHAVDQERARLSPRRATSWGHPTPPTSARPSPSSARPAPRRRRHARSPPTTARRHRRRRRCCPGRRRRAAAGPWRTAPSSRATAAPARSISASCDTPDRNTASSAARIAAAVTIGAPAGILMCASPWASAPSPAADSARRRARPRSDRARAGSPWPARRHPPRSRRARRW